MRCTEKNYESQFFLLENKILVWSGSGNAYSLCGRNDDMYRKYIV